MSNYQYEYDSDDDEYDDDEEAPHNRKRTAKAVRLKQNAIATTTDVVTAQEILKRHADDSGLLMYRDQRESDMRKAYDRLTRFTRQSCRAKRVRETSKKSRYAGQIKARAIV